MLSNITQYADEDMEDSYSRVKTYIQNEGISREEVDQYIKKYPERIYKNMYEMRFLMFLHENKELFKDVIEATAESQSQPIAIVEKDYYVTMILKLLSEEVPDCVFKGGI